MGFFFNGTHFRSRKVRRAYQKNDQRGSVVKKGLIEKQKYTLRNNHRNKKNGPIFNSNINSMIESASLIKLLNFENCFPNEVYFEVITHLRFKDLMQLRLVNKKFHELINHLPHLYVSKLIRNNVIHFEIIENSIKTNNVEGENRVESHSAVSKMLDITILNIPYINVAHFRNIEFDGFFPADNGQKQYHESDKEHKLETLDFPDRYYINNIQDINAFEMIRYLSECKNLKFINISRLINNLIDICEWQSQEGIVDDLFETKLEFLVKQCSINEAAIDKSEKNEILGTREEHQNDDSENQADQDIHKGKLNDISPILSSLELGKFRIFEILLDLINDDFKREIHDQVLKFAIHSKNEAMIDFLVSYKNF